MKILLIGGTGTISSAVSELLLSRNNELFILNRGKTKSDLPEGVNKIEADINDEEKVKNSLKDLTFDVVVNFIVFTENHARRDYRLFKDKTKQYIFISSASAYEKPPKNYVITEKTPLSNPYWEYSRNKIACEKYYYKLLNEGVFPVTVVRPSHTYGKKSIPLGIHGNKGSWQTAKRMIENKPVIIHGDGTSLWTMTHNTDFAKGFAGIAGNLDTIGESFHITSDEVLTWNDIYKYVSKALGVKLNAVHVSSEMLIKTKKYDFTGTLLGDKSNCSVFDNTKLKKYVPGFEAQTDFKKGIKETVEHIKSHPELQIQDPEFDLWCDDIVDAVSDTIIS